MKISPVIYFLLVFVLMIQSCRDKEQEHYSVKRVVDGDTFWVKDGTEKGMKIRLIGVNTPETVHPQKPVEYYGKEASAFMKSLLEGKNVILEYDVERKDRYGRTLAYVYLEDGTFVNALLVEEGYAQVATYPPNVKYAEKFSKLQREAREQNKGLWNKDSLKTNTTKDSIK